MRLVVNDCLEPIPTNAALRIKDRSKGGAHSLNFGYNRSLTYMGQ